jgi:hypothetical protein
MSKISIGPFARLISSSKIIDENMNISSLLGRWRNYNLNKMANKEIQKYCSNHSDKFLK